MTKKHIWAKLLIVALVIAMVCVVFVGCNDETPPDPTPTPPDTGAEAFTELLGVVDDAVAAIGGIDNIGSLGTDAFVEVVVNDTKVRIDLDLSLDLLRATGEGAYGQNGFGFTVSVNDKQEFGLWYADMASDDNSFIYLAADGQKLKIDGLTLAKVLARYDVNADVAVGDKLTEALGGQTITDMAADLAGTVASMLTIGYDNSNPNSKVFTLSVKELFNPSGLVATMLDGLLFDEATVGFDLAQILSDAGIGLTSMSQLYTILPDINLKVTGNYNSGVFESIGIGLEIAGKEDGIVLPGTSENPKGFVVVESVPNTSVSATLGFKILPNTTVYNTLADTVEGYLADTTWRNIGVANIAFEGQLKLGKTDTEYKTYDIEISADINLAAIADATFVKTVYITDAEGNVTETTQLYLRATGAFISINDEKDILDALLPAINSLYVKMVNTADATDILLINLDEAITLNEENMSFTTGKVTINLSAITGILDTFGVKLDSTVSNMISGIQGEEKSLTTILSLVKPVLNSFINKVPENSTVSLTKPATATADEAATDGATDGATDTATDSGFSLNTVIDIVKKAIACLDTSKWESDSEITAKNTSDLTVGGAKLTFNMTASLLKNAESAAVNGINVVFNEDLKSDYKASIKDEDGVTEIGTDSVVTTVKKGSFVKIGGTGNLFNASVYVTQDKTKTYTDESKADPEYAPSNFSIFVALDIEKIGYGCASTDVIKLADGTPTGSIYTDAGWSVAKADVK